MLYAQFLVLFLQIILSVKIIPTKFRLNFHIFNFNPKIFGIRIIMS